MTTVDTDLEHGTRVGYQRGCKCADCKAAAARYLANWRASKTGLPEGDPRHGTVNGYENYGCRCALCAEARRVARRHCQTCQCREQAS